MTSVRVDDAIVRRELEDLTRAVADETVVANAAVRRQLARLVSCVAELQRHHPPSERGFCRTCGRWRACPVRRMLSHYASAWDEASPPPPGPRHAASRSRQWSPA